MIRTSRGAWVLGLLAPIVAVGVAGAAPPKTESWDACYMGGAKVGHYHTWIEPVKDGGRDFLRVRVKLMLSFKRNKDPISISMEYGTIENLDGSILRLDTRFLASGREMRVHGDAADGKMNLSFGGAGETQQKAIDWPADVRGPYAVEQSLSKEPMKAGDVRALKMYIPELNQVCEITLTAGAFEDVKLGGGVTRKLLKVDQTTSLDGKARPEFDLSLWVDSGGQVLKQKTDSNGGMVFYRTTREGAEAPNDPSVSFDQILASIIPVKSKINRPESTRDVRYRVGLRGENPAQLLPSDRRQTVTAGASANEALMEIRTAGPAAGAAEPNEADPVFLRPNAMITCRDARVLDHARKAVGNANDPWEKAKKIQHWVAKNLNQKNFETGFAPASEVAETLSGDCTEHSVLVAAMCRASGVPSRVAVGLVYAETLGGFGFHMWNEVFVNHRWVAIDAAFDQDDVDAVHLKLADSSLDGVSPFEAFLPIVRVLGKMTIEPIEVR